MANRTRLPSTSEIDAARHVERLLSRAILKSGPIRTLATLVEFGEVTVKISDGVPVYVGIQRGHKEDNP